MLKWQKKLTRVELKHLKDTDARTLAEVKANVDFQDKNQFPCWDCVSIGRKLNMEIKLTAFNKKEM